MPRCQRTFQRLPAVETTPGTGIVRWECTCCLTPEVYQTLRDSDLLHYAAFSESVCTIDFGRPSDVARPYLLLYGLRPECVLEPGERRYDLYVNRDSDPYQLRLQIGHEMFHRVVSEGRVFHWTHEMLACMASVRLLRKSGATDYATRVEQDYQAEAEQLTFAEMLAIDPFCEAVYPAGYYGRAYVTGLALKQAIGWNRLCTLARRLNRMMIPDVEGWLAALSLPERRAVADVIPSLI